MVSADQRVATVRVPDSFDVARVNWSTKYATIPALTTVTAISETNSTDTTFPGLTTSVLMTRADFRQIGKCSSPPGVWVLFAPALLDLVALNERSAAIRSC